jgi:hypothetical protein
MSISCDTSDAPAFVRFTVDGAWPDATELVQLRGAAVRDGHLNAQSAELFDLRGATLLPNQFDLRHAVALTPHNGDAVWSACRAYLVGSDDQLEVARQWQQIQGQSAASEIFRKESLAIEWLAAMAARTHGVKG